jgi:hypothetical protein
MQPTIPNTRNFEIMLKIVPIDGIGLSCVALEISRTSLMHSDNNNDWHRITALCVFLLQTT